MAKYRSGGNICGHVIRTAATEVYINVLGKPQNAGCFAAKISRYFEKNLKEHSVLRTLKHYRNTCVNLIKLHRVGHYSVSNIS